MKLFRYEGQFSAGSAHKQQFDDVSRLTDAYAMDECVHTRDARKTEVFRSALRYHAHRLARNRNRNKRANEVNRNNRRTPGQSIKLMNFRMPLVRSARMEREINTGCLKKNVNTCVKVTFLHVSVISIF